MTITVREARALVAGLAAFAGTALVLVLEFVELAVVRTVARVTGRG